eukprot:bmy_07706T0
MKRHDIRRIPIKVHSMKEQFKKDKENGTLSHFGGSEGNELRPQQNETEKLLNEALSGENEKSMKERRGKDNFPLGRKLLWLAGDWALSRAHTVIQMTATMDGDWIPTPAFPLPTKCLIKLKPFLCKLEN